MNSILKDLVDYLPPHRQVKKYTMSQNLGQTYKGTPKYFSTNENGENTGVGYAFEDLTRLTWEKEGHHVEQVDPALHAPDYILDGTKTQLKCGKDAHSSARAFYEGSYGPCKYSDQVGVVPAEHGRLAEKTFGIRSNMGCGRPIAVIESPVSRKEAENYTFKGKESFKMDFCDPNIVMTCFETGAEIGALGYAIDVTINSKNMNKSKAISKTLQWTLISALTGIALTAMECGYRQTLRPKKD